MIKENQAIQIKSRKSYSFTMLSLVVLISLKSEILVLVTVRDLEAKSHMG